MTEPRSEWSLTASCTSCRGTFSLASTAVLLRSSLFGPRGVVLDVLGERWPEPGLLFHPRCFAMRFGRRPLWTAFMRGRVDKGVARPRRSATRGRGNQVVVIEDAPWSLSVNCCACSTPVATAGPAVVREGHAPRRWRWVPVFQERRPGQRRVYHLRCFVARHGRAAAYALLGRDLWEHLPPVIKKIGGAISPLP
jgi:hypothetical protein